MSERLCTVVNLGLTQHDVYIGRAGNGYDGYFGNPFRLVRESDRSRILAFYRTWFNRRIERDPVFRKRVLELQGKRLGCFCAPRPCHGDVIAEWVNANAE